MPQHRQIPWFGYDDIQGRWALVHGEGIAPHSHAQGQLLYAASGVLATTTVGGTWVSPANRISWTPPHFEHCHRAYGDTEISILEVPEALCAALPAHPGVFAVSGLLREAVLKLTGGSTLRPAVADRLLRVIVDELTERPEQALHLPEPVDDRLRAVTDRLHADPASPATLGELGRAVGASERTLSRLFRTELGMSFNQWRTLLRVQHALVHLAHGHAVTEIAVRCGWSNPTSFIEAFTALIGQTPGRYQADLRHPREISEQTSKPSTRRVVGREP
ncbi:helix-turn-helix domain-containing protein [Nocardia brasiliensis]|uniref:helix-turn-helix domain-containing protein n=1 Tax=Nocardia brasiliensis TaxID=37326 RepID=UPI00245384F1|nr:helix-turn-helix transcriptional regulator [Nocardia brasiliensis]